MDAGTGLVGLNGSHDEGSEEEEEGMGEFMPSPDPLTLHRAALDDTRWGFGEESPRTGLTPRPHSGGYAQGGSQGGSQGRTQGGSQGDHSADHSDDGLFSSFISSLKKR